jgi:hypothetical protein
MMGFKCHTCKGFVPIPKVGDNANRTKFKWKDKTHMTKVVVCESCWSRARSLKVL